MNKAGEAPTTSTLWTDTLRTRHFILPDDAEMPPGDFPLRTAAGRRRSVQESAVLQYEVTKETARAWAEARLTQVSEQFLGKSLGIAERLQKRTAKLREQNRAAWEHGIANAPPAVRPAAQKLHIRIQEAADRLRRLKHPPASPTTDDPTPPDPPSKPPTPF